MQTLYLSLKIKVPTNYMSSNNDQNYLPAEWQPQQAILITWPHLQTDWIMLMEKIELTYLEIAYYISCYQPLVIIVYDQKHQEHVLKQLIKRRCQISNIQMLMISTNDTWIRDYGPIFTREQKKIQLKVQLNDCGFNGWGHKFPFYNDNLMTEQLIDQISSQDFTYKKHDIVLEGGNLETDGCGTLLTTQRCLLDVKRNPGMNKEQIENFLKKELHIKKILWLQHGYLEGDDTDGHIDLLARFCSPTQICYASSTGGGSKQALALDAMEKQ